ncbi:glycosyltransferase [Miniphocaeibacter massiliensis]|uniref:glycosyltransferase n=1 Tax=Miniphocaeibacter massiliensis TaxID=2041841 RepID=UPI000C1BF157|nr:glycosyltransferase [Miniphocaeibacter massiliensis]
MKKMIYHIPYFVDKNRQSGSHIRPFKMLNAFKNIGYEVDVVMGYGESRKKSITEIKKNIENGVKYDFCYSESSTMPTLLTEENHLPKYPFLDFGFFKFLKQHNIKIGLFYRDCYWLFEEGTKSVSDFKKKVSNFFYRYDLKKYPEFLDVFYLPTLLMKDYIPMNFNGKYEALPPGIDSSLQEETLSVNQENTLKLFYVGGIGPMYKMDTLLKVVSETENIKLVLCCRESEWNAEKPRLSKYLNDNIEIIHKSGVEYKEDIETSDIASVFFEQSEYRKFAMSVKLFEYLAYNKPVLSVTNTAVGQFVEEYNIGWNVSYDENELKNLLIKLRDNKKEIENKANNIADALQENTWEARARKVSKDLT